MQQGTKRFSSIIIALLIIVAAVAVYFVLIVPAYTNLENLKGQEASEQTLYTNEKQIVNQVQSLLSSYQNNSSSSQAVALALPIGQNVAGALAQIYGIGANAGVTVAGTTISIQAVQSAPAPSDLTGAAASGAIIKPTGTVSFQINGTGSYEAFNAFLQDLQTNIRLFDVTSISLQSSNISNAATKVANEDMFTYSITVVTYYQAP